MSEGVAGREFRTECGVDETLCPLWPDCPAECPLGVAAREGRVGRRVTVKRRVTVTAADVDEGSLAELRRRVGNLEAFLEGLAAYTAGSSSLTDYGAESTECDG